MEQFIRAVLSCNIQKETFRPPSEMPQYLLNNYVYQKYNIENLQPLHIEYFLLHEIRHIYQHLEIEDYRTDPSKCNSVELAREWSEEENNYVMALDKDGNENAEYFAQDMEMDAFAYSYAVMKYKYGEVEYLYIPKAYINEEFDKIVAEWQETFKNEGL